MDAITRTTELEALNKMLASVNHSLATSTDSGQSADIDKALEVLRETSRDVQLEGWSFNQERAYLLEPDGDGYLSLPTNTLHAEICETKQLPSHEIVVRGLKLYDMTDQTYVFTDDHYVDLVLGLDWDDLPEPARRYIALKAARVYQQQTVGDTTLYGFTAHDEQEARLKLMQSGAKVKDYNMLNNHSSQKILGKMSTVDRYQ